MSLLPFLEAPWAVAAAIAAALALGYVVIDVVGRIRARHRRAEAAQVLVEAHERLKQERERYRDLTRLSTDWFWEQDAERRITDISMRVGTEAQRKAYVGRTSAEMGWAPMEGEPFQKQLELIARREPYRDFRVQRLEEDGCIRWISNSATPVFDAADGFVGWRGVGHDITNRVREQRRNALREAVGKLLAEDAEAPTLLRDFAEATCRAFGWPGALVLHGDGVAGLPAEVELWAQPEDTPLFERLAASAAAGDDTPPDPETGLRECLAFPVAVDDHRYAELRFHLRGRAAADEASVAKVQHLAGQIALVLAQHEAERQVRAEHELLEARVAERTRDLTRANQDLALAKAGADSANEAKSAFLATMSHEIRTPMNGVIGMVEILSQSELGDEQKDAVRTIRQSAFALLALIDDILDFSKIEAGRVDVERQPLHLAEVVEGVCDLLSPGAAGRGVEMRVFVSPTLPEWIHGDATRLRQTLHNLIGNAIKFSADRPGGGRVEVRVERSRAQPRRVALSVLDNGIGISSEKIGHLFTPFAQAEGSTTRRFGGTGLGLVICKRIVELLGGEIEVDSVEEVGSTFTVTLPLDAAEGSYCRHLPDLSGLHCVVVDSPTFAAADLRAYLEHAGAQVHVALGVHAAVRHVAGRGGETVVLQQTGKELRGQLKARGWFAGTPDVRHLTIVRHAPLGRPEPVLPGLVTLAEAALRRDSLLSAVALAAGRTPQAGRDPAASVTPRGRRQPPSIAEARARRRLILVAEDDAVNQKVILKQLALLGHAAEVAGDGAEALKLWHEGGHALLLTDLHMPRMDGYRLTEAIRAAEAEAAVDGAPAGRPRLPILALTANALRDEAARVRAIGMDEYLTKPIQLKTLDEALERWLPRAPTEPPLQTLPAPLEPSAKSDADPAFDISVLQALVGDDAAVLREFLDDFLQTLRTQGRQLSLALERNEPQRVGAIAHKLKASSRSIGALALGDLCAQLENASKAGSRAEIERVHAEFVAAQAAVDVALVVRLALQPA